MREGFDTRLGTDREGQPLHTRAAVTTEMFLTICVYYKSLPDPLSLSLDEIEFFYDGIRARLKAETKSG